MSYFTNHESTFVHGSREIISFFHDSRQLKIGIHGSRKNPFPTLLRGKTVRPWVGIPNRESHGQTVRVDSIPRDTKKKEKTRRKASLMSGYLALSADRIFGWTTATVRNCSRYCRRTYVTCISSYSHQTSSHPGCTCAEGSQCSRLIERKRKGEKIFMDSVVSNPVPFSRPTWKEMENPENCPGIMWRIFTQ